MKVWSAIWDNRTKVVGYLGMILAQLGTSGLVTSPKAIAWIAFVASGLTSGVGHFNDWKAKREAQE